MNSGNGPQVDRLTPETSVLKSSSPVSGRSLEPGLTGPQIRRRLLTLSRPLLPPLGLSIFFRLLALVAGIALVGLAAWAVMGATSGTARWWPVLGLLVGLSLLKGLTRYLEQYCGHYVAFRALAQLRLYFYDRLAPQAPAAVEGRETGDLLSRVTKDVDRVEVFFAHTIGPAVTALLVPVATLVYLGVAVSPWSVPPLTAGLALVGLVTPALRRAASARAARQVRAARGQLAGQVRDSVQGVREVLAFNYQERRLDSMRRAGEPLAAGLKTLGNAVAWRRGINVSVMALTGVAQLIVLAACGVEPALLGLGLGVTVAAFAPVTAVEDFAADLQQAYASARRIFEITDALPVVPDLAPLPSPMRSTAGGSPVEADSEILVRTDWGIKFQGVTFHYPGVQRSNAALQDVNLTAASGCITAVVGASGSGKSTLAALLTRSWDPGQGSIFLGQRPLTDWPLRELRDRVAVASQRPYLFNLSIRENLLLACPDATAEELERVAQVACLDTVIAQKVEGWEAPVGEMGELLSGGERQRLALARTLLRKPAVLVLDESTSQLDTTTEAKVLEGLRQEANGRTVIVIAHRLSTVRHADAVYVLDAGRVVQQGVYPELATQTGPFADLLAREEASSSTPSHENTASSSKFLALREAGGANSTDLAT